MKVAPLARRRASSGRLRGLAHLVTTESYGLNRKALCGFQPRRYWQPFEAPAWEVTCSACEVKGQSQSDPSNTTVSQPDSP